ncbi:MAG: IclR family transcriptional regulator, partial [Acidobacteria bacterium]|nr:IclR family transcriptional regulator [Acidobacteriota bacterium]
RALHILELMACSESGLSLPQLTRRLDLPKSSTHCLLTTLERCGYVYRNEADNRYKVTWKLFRLANVAPAGVKIRGQVRPFLQDLMIKTALTVHMAVLERQEAVLIEKIEPLGLTRRATWIGKTMDLHASAVGKVLLAHLPDDETLRIIREHGLPRYNENTITSIRRLKQEIAKIRDSGFATEDEEGELGFRCIGAPVFDHTNSVAAAISVAGTVEEINELNFSRIRDLVKGCAASISHSFGCEPREHA